jgi:hypothetical protein
MNINPEYLLESKLENLFVQLKIKLDTSLDEIGLSDNSISETFSWVNHIYHSPSIRYGHLEYFKGEEDKVEVVHCVLFPNYYKGIPIFSFDVIKLSGKVTGLFCDYTASPFSVKELDDELKIIHDELLEFKRELPEGAGGFSKNFLTLSPTENSYSGLEERCLYLLDKYLAYCSKQEFSGHCLDSSGSLLSVKSQNKYSINQRLNSKTQKALSKYVGSEKSKSFIEKTLFPTFKS